MQSESETVNSSKPNLMSTKIPCDNADCPASFDTWSAKAAHREVCEYRDSNNVNVVCQQCELVVSTADAKYHDCVKSLRNLVLEERKRNDQLCNKVINLEQKVDSMSVQLDDIWKLLSQLAESKQMRIVKLAGDNMPPKSSDSEVIEMYLKKVDEQKRELEEAKELLSSYLLESMNDNNNNTNNSNSSKSDSKNDSSKATTNYGDRSKQTATHQFGNQSAKAFVSIDSYKDRYTNGAVDDEENNNETKNDTSIPVKKDIDYGKSSRSTFYTPCVSPANYTQSLDRAKVKSAVKKPPTPSSGGYALYKELLRRSKSHNLDDDDKSSSKSASTTPSNSNTPKSPLSPTTAGKEMSFEESKEVKSTPSSLGYKQGKQVAFEIRSYGKQALVHPDTDDVSFGYESLGDGSSPSDSRVESPDLRYRDLQEYRDQHQNDFVAENQEKKAANKVTEEPKKQMIFPSELTPDSAKTASTANEPPRFTSKYREFNYVPNVKYRSWSCKESGN